ncbi:MAG: hypothetical protein ACI3XG_06250, partial [Faecousia sp.]
MVIDKCSNSIVHQKSALLLPAGFHFEAAPFNGATQETLRHWRGYDLPCEKSPAYRRDFYVLTLSVFLVSAMDCHAVVTLRWTVPGVSEEMKNRIRLDAVILVLALPIFPASHPA